MTASYDINSAALYSYDNGTYTLIEGDVSGLQGPPAIDDSPTAISTTITTTDGGALDNDVFELNENVTSAAGVAGQYAGYITVDGQDFMVLTNSSFNNTLYVVSSAPIEDFPDSFEGGGIDFAPLVECFATGTLIATPQGERAVETLKTGDLLHTADGRAVPVIWVGRQTVMRAFTPTDRFVPVRITAGALGDGVPHSDLLVTGDHAMVVDDLAINASALVNGTTIRWEPQDRLAERFTYYHLETEAHDVILANGAPAESFIDYVGRRAFDNFAEYLDLFGEERTIGEMDRVRISAARLVPADIRARLARAGKPLAA